MTPSSPQHEPTMEEILASIRKIISEDSTEVPQPKADADVLELTQEVQEEPVSPPSAPPAAPPPMASPEPEHHAEPSPMAIVEPEHHPEAAAEPQNDIVSVSHEETTVSGPAEAPEHDGIFSEKSRKALDDAFASLDEVDEPPPAAEVPPKATAAASSVDGSSVEAVFERAVRGSVEPLLHQWMDGRKDELLASIKPMIREWMDEHFPALLEGAVRDEVARVVKARGKR
jgi:uncharacterized protein